VTALPGTDFVLPKLIKDGGERYLEGGKILDKKTMNTGF